MSVRRIKLLPKRSAFHGPQYVEGCQEPFHLRGVRFMVDFLAFFLLRGGSNATVGIEQLLSVALKAVDEGTQQRLRKSAEEFASSSDNMLEKLAETEAQIVAAGDQLRELLRRLFLEKQRISRETFVFPVIVDVGGLPFILPFLEFVERWIPDLPVLVKDDELLVEGMVSGLRGLGMTGPFAHQALDRLAPEGMPVNYDGNTDSSF